MHPTGRYGRPCAAVPGSLSWTAGRERRGDPNGGYGPARTATGDPRNSNFGTSVLPYIKELVPKYRRGWFLPTPLFQEPEQNRATDVGKLRLKAPLPSFVEDFELRYFGTTTSVLRYSLAKGSRWI